MRGVTLVFWSVAIVGAMACTPPTVAQTPSSLTDSSRAVAFDRLDRTARTLIATVDCAIGTSQARARGLFGPPDSLGLTGLCLRKDGRAFGVFFSTDSTYTKVQNLRAVDLANGVRYLGQVDTAAILNEARAAREAVRKGFPPFQREERQFAPLSMRSDGDSIEVWLLPAGLFARQAPSTLGGERAFVYSPDGRTVAREIDAFDRYRSFTMPESGQVEMLSLEEDLPLVSELIATELIHRRGREVRVVTERFISQLAGPAPATLWFHTHRR